MRNSIKLPAHDSQELRQNGEKNQRKGKRAYCKKDAVHTPKMKDWMSWKKLRRSSLVEGKAGNKTSEVEMISTKMIAQVSGKT